MPARMTQVWPEVALARIGTEFAEELLAATDEEIMDAARDLGMNPAMKGSAAFAGVKYPISARALQSFFAMHTDSQSEVEVRVSAEAPPRSAPFTKARKDRSGE
jgi:hypothetical protein